MTSPFNWGFDLNKLSPEDRRKYCARVMENTPMGEAVKDILFNKPGKSTIPDDYEPTQEELEQVYIVNPSPSSERDELK